MNVRSQIHMLTVAAARLEEAHGSNPALIAALRNAAKELAGKRARGEHWTPDEQRRVDRQRTLFNILPNGPAKAQLIDAMLQRAYDLLWDGDGPACDAITEFLPSIEVEKMLAAWEQDQRSDTEKSRWYQPEAE